MKYADDPLTPAEVTTGVAVCTCGHTYHIRSKDGSAVPVCECGRKLVVTPDVYEIAPGMMPVRRPTYDSELP